MSRIISVPVTWKPARRKPDDTVDLSFNTNLEVPVEEMTVYDMMRKSSGWLIYSEDPLSKADIPKSAPAAKEGKSPAARLRAALWVVWKQKHPDAQPAEFEAYYLNQMEAVILKVKEQIED